MAIYYLDTSAIGNEYQAYAATPTWGGGATDKPLPMDGTGRAGPGHSAAVAIAEIQITVLPADGNTLAIAGATLTAKTTAAAKNQWTISGAISTCITNLRDLINTYGTGTAQCDATVSASVSQLSLNLPYWCFARVKPGTTDTLQIATRIAGADLNHATNSNVAITSSGWGTPPTITQFAGGAHGPFAYFYATATVFGKTWSASTAGNTPTYGLLGVAAAAPTNPVATDAVIVRTRRNGVDITVTVSTTAQIGIVAPTRTFVFDDGTSWSGDGGQFTLDLNTNTSAGASGWTSTTLCRYLARKQYGFKVKYTGINTSRQFGLNCNNSGSAPTPSMEWQNTYFDEGNSTSQLYVSASGNSSVYLFSGCYFNASGARNLGGSNGNNNSWSVRYYSCTFNYYLAGPTPSGLIALNQNTGGGSDSLVEFSNCIFLFASGGPITQLFSGAGTLNSTFRCIVSDCVGLRPETMPGLADDYAGHRSLVWTGCADSLSGISARSALIDTGHAQRSWIDNGTSPYIAGTVLPTGSAWAMKCLIKAGRSSTITFELARMITLYRAATASKVIAVEMLVPTGVTFTKERLFALITFTDSAGSINYASTARDYSGVIEGVEAAIDSSSASWTNAGGFEARKLTFDTSTVSKQILQGSEISVRVMYRGNTPGAADRTVYCSPELVLT